MITVHLDEVASTQDEARDRWASEPTLVTATRQRSGRGRSGVGWQNAPRAVAASLAFSVAGWSAETRPVLTLVAGLAMIDTIDGLELKWPNDLLRGDSKSGGILTEALDEVVVVGVGVNLWWPDPPEGIVGVYDVDPGDAAVRSVPEQWARKLVEAVAAGPGDWGRDRYREACATLGERVTWEGAPGPGEGVAVDIGRDGALLVDTDQGMVELRSGAVTHVRTV
ncbi:MAG: biotin--[acetyl-CoA-carboxylase] ligase [Acidimicrobiia bacterium]|nr:biotin--[acetyl-CoA-carboxylase] ligase [Acidimicrobiia bacterium]